MDPEFRSLRNVSDEDVDSTDGGPGNDGLEISGGDRVVIPAGALRFSLDRQRGSGQFTYRGISWFVRTLIENDAADDQDQIRYSLGLSIENGEAVLQQSALLSDIDLDDESQFDAVFERLSEDQASPEWFAFLKVAFAQIAQDAIDSGDAALAAWAAQRTALAHAAFIFERDLKPLIWRGYGSVGADQLGEALDLWQENRQNGAEDFWQEQLTLRPFLLSQLLAAAVVIEEGKAYVGGKGVSNKGGNVVDFLLAQPVLENVVLLEIKTPDAPLLRTTEYRGGIYGPSAELGGGVAQVASYRDSLLRDFNSLRNAGTSYEVFNPRCVLLIGNAAQLHGEARRRSFELFRNGLRDIEVVTYDELFARAELLREVLAKGSAAPTTE